MTDPIRGRASGGRAVQLMHRMRYTRDVKSWALSALIIVAVVAVVGVVVALTR